jgi:thiamine biosynthesis lipoprotein
MPWGYELGAAGRMKARMRFSIAVALGVLAVACENPGAPKPIARADAARASDQPRFLPVLVELDEPAMGTRVHLGAYTTPAIGEEPIKRAMTAAVAEMRRLEALMTSWRQDSEIAAVNRGAGTAVRVGPETFEVIDKSLWAGKVSHGAFDITFQSMSGLWKFGDAAESVPKVPSAAEVERLRKLVDYRLLELDAKARTVKVPKGRSIVLGGIAKGYAVDRAASVLKQRGLSSFLVQAGGDLYGAGRKPNGAPWVSGIQDPRGPQGSYFAILDLEDHAFSTAGDYARSYMVDGKRYHHIIDPKTGYPATASRSVTIWARDAFTADAIDDGVFILGPEKGLELVESLEDVGAVIVDKNNKLWLSKRVQGRVKILQQPTNAD